MSIYTELNYRLYRDETPYTNCEVEKYIDNNYPHTNIDSTLLDCLFEHFKPNFVLEIGSMVGGSCIKMLDSFKTVGLNDSYIVCVDPFTGDANMWDWEYTLQDWYRFLRLENGIPTIYKRFLANTYQYKDKIVPINCTAFTGINLLERLYNTHKSISSLPTLIYLDSSHCKNETFLEIVECWDKLLGPNTLLFGDDFSHPDVTHDVLRAAKTFTLNLTLRDQIKDKLSPISFLKEDVLVYNNQWMLYK